MSLPVYRYPLDPTGINRDNLVLNEPHDLNPKSRITDVRVVAPLYGPVYSESVIVTDMLTGRVLDVDVDYKLTDLLQSATLKFALPVTQFIVITNGTVSNKVEVTYQCVGGNYQNDSTAVLHAYETFLNDARAVDWEDITGKPQGYPPSPHIHLLEDVIGWGPMLWALDRIREAILLSNSSVFENFLEWFKYRPVDWNLVVNRPTTLEGYGIVDAVHISRRIRTINGIQGGGTLANDLTLQLTITGVNPGTYGTNTAWPTFIVDDRGRITQAATFNHSFLTLLDKPTTLQGYGITDAVDTFSNQGNILGQKVWRTEMIQEHATSTNTDSYRTSDRDYGAFWRMESKKFWLLLTNSGNARGNNNAFRPFMIDMVTGEVHIATRLNTSTTINGNAASADRLSTPRKISLAQGATGEVLFNGSQDVVIPVTALDVSRVNAGVLTGTFGGTGLNVFVPGQYFVAETNAKMKNISAADMMTDIGKTRKIIPGVGMVGGGDLGTDVTINMGTPGTLTGNTGNAATVGSHTHQLAAATTTVGGVVRLATDQEVKDNLGNGVVTPPQLKNLVKFATTVPIKDGGPTWSFNGAVGTSELVARGDHIHPSDLKMRGNNNGGIVVSEGQTRSISKEECGMFLVCFENSTIYLPDPSQFTAADAGTCVRAYVHGYNTFANVVLPKGYAGSGQERYKFFSTVCIVLVRRQDGGMGWFTTDDGHTIFTDSQDAYYQNLCYTRLGNPAWGHIAGPYGMVGGTLNGLGEGVHSLTYFHAQNRWLAYRAVRAFVNVGGAQGSTYVANVLSMTNTQLTFEIKKLDGPGSWSGVTASIIIFGC